MRHFVPAFEFDGILEPEIRREIDDFDVRSNELARLCHGDPMRGREENDLARLQVGVGRIAVSKLAQTSQSAQALEHVGDVHPSFLARGDELHACLRMERQQPEQLDPGITRASDDADIDHRSVPHPASLALDGMVMTMEYPDAAAAAINAKAASRRPLCRCTTL